MNNDKIRKNIRLNLIRLRKEKGYSQRDIADAIGRKAPSVASWEQGISLPDIPTLYRLSILFGRSMDYFVEHNEDDENE